MYARSVLKVMLDEAFVPGVVEHELIRTDRVLQRWAVSIGLGLPTEEWDDRPVSRVPPLDDGTAIVVDQIILKSPPKTRHLTKQWYKTPTPSVQIAMDLNMSRRSLEKAWNVSLHYFKWKFEGSGHSDLLKLLRSHV